MFPYQNVLWLASAVFQASIVILTVVAAFLIFFLTFSWSYLQKAKELEQEELKALNGGRSLTRKLMQMYRPEIMKVYESWFKEKPEDIDSVVEVLSKHPLISRINSRQRLLLFLVGPRFLAEFLPILTFVLGLFIFIFILARKWIYLRLLWVSFCIFSGMPIGILRKDKLGCPLISPFLFFFALVRTSPIIKGFRKCGIDEFKMGKLGPIKFEKSDTEKEREYLRPELIQWGILHETSELFSSRLLFPLQLDFMKQASTSFPPVRFYPNIECELFRKAKERNMPEKFTEELRRLSKKCSDDSKKKLEGIITRIDTYRSLIARFSMFLKTRGRVFLKVVVGSLIVLCTASALLSLLVISGVLPADPIAGNLVRIAMSLLISAIMGVCIVVALLLKSF